METKKIRVGNILEIDNGFFTVISTEHVKPGKGGAFMQVTMKSPFTGQKLERRFRVEERVNKIDLIEKEGLFTHIDTNKFVFLTDDGDILEKSQEEISNKELYIPGIKVKMFFIENTFVSCELPNEIELTISISAPVIKGQSAAAQYKTAFSTTGIEIRVPQYVKIGDKIIINNNGEFIRIVR